MVYGHKNPPCLPSIIPAPIHCVSLYYTCLTYVVTQIIFPEEERNIRYRSVASTHINGAKKVKFLPNNQHSSWNPFFTFLRHHSCFCDRISFLMMDRFEEIRLKPTFPSLQTKHTKRNHMLEKTPKFKQSKINKYLEYAHILLLKRCVLEPT